MNTTIGQLYHKLQKLPFPDLGKEIGDFPLYDSLLSGLAATVLQGGKITRRDVPEPDQETAEAFKKIKKSPQPAPREAAFLKYFQVLQDLRRAIVSASDPVPSRAKVSG